MAEAVLPVVDVQQIAAGFSDWAEVYCWAASSRPFMLWAGLYNGEPRLFRPNRARLTVGKFVGSTCIARLVYVGYRMCSDPCFTTTCLRRPTLPDVPRWDYEFAALTN